MSYVESKTLTVETSNSEKDSAKLLILPINTYEEITIGDIDKEITKIIKHLSEKDPIIESFVDKVVPRKKNMYKKLCNAVFIYVSEEKTEQEPDDEDTIIIQKLREIKSPIKIPTFNKNQIDEKYDGDNNEQEPDDEDTIIIQKLREIKSPIKIPTFNKNQIDEKYDGVNNEKYYLAFYVLNYNYE